ncbi:HRDC domain-containing protein [Williamsia deligens]|uniref:HRDC domain-containing protein n=1 Tax=Williamsia deligens TaxID=321325 RepID=A0ABW3GGH6_9NOCA|nr:ribonuclease D [Williamsia deligens]MCP2195384.1 ribonuclease D [Williamsia deligens]
MTHPTTDDPGTDPVEPDAPDSDATEPDVTDEPVVTPLDSPAEGVPPVLSYPSEFADAAARLADGEGPIALDTERASGFRYSNRAYLIQIRRRGSGSFLIDPIDNPDALGPLIEVLDGPQWVLHAADQDLPCLRELGFVCADLFDTELAGRLLGVPRVNLAAMVAHFLGLGLAKGHGAADWSKRPLPDDWLNYAALDVEVLVELRDAVATALDEAGKTAWAEQEFDHVRTKPEPPPRVDRWRRTSGLHTVKAPRTLAAVRELWTTREELAAQRDVAPGRVLPDSAIVAAATKGPASVEELVALPVFGGHRQRRSVRRWFDALDRARRLPDSELPPRSAPTTGLPAVNRWANRNPDAAARIGAARPAMAALSDRVLTPVENLLQPDLLRQICWDGVEPTTEDEVTTRLVAAGARPWQAELCAPVLAEALTVAAAGPVDADVDVDVDGQ